MAPDDPTHPDPHLPIARRLEAPIAEFTTALAETLVDAVVERAGSLADGRLEQLRAALEERLAAFAAYQHEQLLALDGRLEVSERSVYERIGDAEARVQSGRDDLDEVRSATGRVREELERLRDDQLDDRDRLLVRIADLEARASERLDVNAAVQIERLDEIERQLLALDPTNVLSQPATGRRWADHEEATGVAAARTAAPYDGVVAPPPSMRLAEMPTLSDGAVHVGFHTGVGHDSGDRPVGPEMVGAWSDEGFDADPWRADRSPFTGP